jgi:Histidine kinase-like ATPase domain
VSGRISTERIVLEPVSASVPQARRFVADRLSDLPQETVDVARLLVSEVVTNAVLHARTNLSLTLERNDTTVNVRVEDENPVLPVLRTHGTDAGTGRGLWVLESMASRWGSHSVDGGKVVWFELHMDGSGPMQLRSQHDRAEAFIEAAPPERKDPRNRHTRNRHPNNTAPRTSRRTTSTVGNDDHDPRGHGEPLVPADQRGVYEEHPELITLQWLGLPIGKLDRTAEHYDAVLREFRLVLERQPEARAAVPGRLLALMDDLTNFEPLISNVERDMERGRRAELEQVDVTMELPRAIGPLALRLDHLLDESDAYCAAGVELLSLEPPSEVVAVRKWLIGEVARQAEGHPPVAWQESPWAKTSLHHRRPPA